MDQIPEVVIRNSRKDIRLRSLGAFGDNDERSYYSLEIVNALIQAGAEEMYKDTDGIEDRIGAKSTTGAREIYLPPEFLRAKLVLYDGLPLREAQLVLTDFSDSASNGTPIWFSIFGWPTPTLYLGPCLASSSVEVDIFYYRGPRQMTSDSEIIELPPMFIDNVTNYVKGHLALNDKMYQSADRYIQQFNAGREKFKFFMANNSRSNYVEALHDYGGFS